MKLISKTLSVNGETFQPELIITMSIPLEPMLDSAATFDEDHAALTIGKAFMNMMGESEKSLHGNILELYQVPHE